VRKDDVASPKNIFLLLIMLGSLFACAAEPLNETFVSEPYVRERWLSYLEDGKTEREEIIQKLGEPTSSFQGNKILGYRLLLIEDGRKITEKEYRTALINFESAYRDRYYGWINNRRKQLSEKGTLFTVRDQNKEDEILELLSREAEYSLVLVFDDQNTLTQHSLRRIMP
jgi:hypothetical protein